MRYDAYVDRLVGRIFKLLPMREQEEQGAQLFLDAYISDLADEVSGACVTFPELLNVPEFVGVVNSLNYLRHHWLDLSFGAYRSTVLKMTNGTARLIEDNHWQNVEVRHERA